MAAERDRLSGMSTHTRVAKKCFDENLRLFVTAKNEPEKFNLYSGLHALAEALEGIENELDTIDRRLRGLTP